MKPRYLTSRIRLTLLMLGGIGSPVLGVREWVVHEFESSSSYSTGPIAHKKTGEVLSTEPYLPKESTRKRESAPMPYQGNPRPLTSRGVVREMIVNAVDGRHRISPIKAFPDTIHGQIDIDCGNGIAGGSGTMVGAHHFLTAAHCVYGADMGGWARNLTVHLALDDTSAPYGAYQATKVYVYKSWIDTKGNDNEHDLALIVLNRSIGYRTGWAGLLSLDLSELRKSSVNVTGYPGDKGCKQLWSMEDKLLNIDDTTFSYKIDTMGGQSGGAVWVAQGGLPSLIGVHTSGSATRNFGVRLSQQKFQDVISWMSQTATLTNTDLDLGDGWAISDLDDVVLPPYNNTVNNSNTPLLPGPPPRPASLPTYSPAEARDWLGMLTNPAAHLIKAAEDGDIERVNLLLIGYPEVSVQDTKHALEKALNAQDADMIKLFISNAETRPGYDTIVLKGSFFFSVKE